MTRRNLTWAALIGVLALLMTSFAPAFMASAPEAEASSHREAPLISMDPVADATDVYAFVSPERPDTVTLISNWIPFEVPSGGPNFYQFGQDVLYEQHIDNVGDAQDHISFGFRFKTVVVNPNTFLATTGPSGKIPDLQDNLRQYMTVYRYDAPSDGSCKNMSLANCPTAKTTVLGENIQVAPNNIGPDSFPIYPATAAMAVSNIGNGITVFAGPRADSFFADIGALFDLLTIRNPGVNNFAGYNVHAIEIQVPINQLTKDGSRPTDIKSGSAVIGTWATSSRRATKVFQDADPTSATQTNSGAWVQVQRLGMPLVNEVVVPLALKDAFNALKPWQDATIPAVVALITDPEPARLLKAIYGVDVPPTPRNDILMVFAQGVTGLNQPPNVVPSEQLRLNVAVPPSANPNSMGVLGGDVAGFPNGRRLGDDVIDASLQVVAGVLVNGYNKSPNNKLGDNVNGPAANLSNTFPYQALPYSGFYTFAPNAVNCTNSQGNVNDRNANIANNGNQYNCK